MSLSVDRFRQVLFGLAIVLAAAVAWLGGSALFHRGAMPGDAALLARVFPAAEAGSGPSRADRTLASFSDLTSRRLVPPAPVAGAVDEAPPFILLSIRYDPAAVPDATAVVKNSRNSIRGYKVGETVEEDQARVLGILPGKATFLWHGRQIELTLQIANPVLFQGDAKPVPVQTEFAITAEEWKQQFGNIDALYKQITFEAFMVGGEKKGLILKSIAEGCPALKYGFRSGDIIHKVNGKSFSPLDLMKIVPTLAQPQPMSVELERGGKRLTLTLKVGAPKP